jgi:hypothetical protein
MFSAQSRYVVAGVAAGNFEPFTAATFSPRATGTLMGAEVASASPG